MSIGTTDFESVFRSFVEQDRILEVLGPIKSGKEASVFRCRAHPSSGEDDLALKVYRPRSHRSFKNDGLYREGSAIYRIGGGKTRQARALRSGTRFGRDVQEMTWAGHEWGVLQCLHASGLPVPRPVHLAQGAILMELFVDAAGEVAPPLGKAHLEPRLASGLFAALCDDVERMLWLDVLHGDLSPYNVLWNGEEYRIIDFPQAVDPRFNGSALSLLRRDLSNVGRFCARFGEIPDPELVAIEMWARFQRGESNV